jgi:hypothetical protein
VAYLFLKKKTSTSSVTVIPQKKFDLTVEKVMAAAPSMTKAEAVRTVEKSQELLAVPAKVSDILKKTFKNMPGVHGLNEYTE